MSRPLRVEFPGAIYHVTSRGDRREPIYRDDDDRRMQLDVLAQALERFDGQVLAYCLMGNHYHLVLTTQQPNLSRLMRHFNGVYTQRFNRRHAVVGHLFQGRFKAILVDRDAYLLGVCRYVERNPVAAGLVATVAAWPWSSYSAHVGALSAPTWLDTGLLQRMLLQRDPRGPADRRLAGARYAAWVDDASAPSPWGQDLRQQVFLGDEAFVERMTSLASPVAMRSSEIPHAQRRVTSTLADFVKRCGSRDQALHAAYAEGGMTMTHLAAQSGLSVSRVSRIVSGVERMRGEVAKGKT